MSGVGGGGATADSGASADGAGASTGGVQSVDRALHLLEALGVSGGALGIAELAEATGLPVGTVHRLMGAMRTRGFVQQGEDRRYGLAAKLIPLGTVARDSLETVVQPLLQRLVAETGETSNAAMVWGDRVRYLAQVPSPHAMRMFTEVGRTVDVYSTAVGKALAAGWDDERIVAALTDQGLRQFTPNTIASIPAYLAEIGRVRAEGYARDESEREWGVRCVAMVLGTGPGQVAVSVSGPEARFTEEQRDRAVAVMRDLIGGL